jgi:hypothetical protein
MPKTSCERFIEMEPQKLTRAVAKMSSELGISGSIAGCYSLYDAILQEQKRAKEKVKAIKDFCKKLEENELRNR